MKYQFTTEIAKSEFFKKIIRKDQKTIFFRRLKRLDAGYFELKLFLKLNLRGRIM